MASHSGNIYKNIHTSGSGRAHLGDVHNYHGPSPDEQASRSVLESLRYDDMTDRRDRLSSAERDTFTWAFADGGVGCVAEWSDVKEFHTRTKTIDVGFVTWLKGQDENLFCFMGKPGSGKSTLMYVPILGSTSDVTLTRFTRCRKYLANDPMVDHALETWAQGKVIVRAEHFFWVLGGPEQKSREGLLRHLLRSALLSLSSSADNENLELKRLVLGPRGLSNGGQHPRAYDELYKTFVRLTSCPNAKFMFLIDALDECEPQGRLRELADEILKISSLPNVKLCVSCRPWNAFVRRFHEAQTIRLGVFTHHDMELYVSSRLASADGPDDLCSEFRDPDTTMRARTLVTSVAHTSDGVFLWTELVVKALSRP
jgi:hypothetical protein